VSRHPELNQYIRDSIDAILDWIARVCCSPSTVASAVTYENGLQGELEQAVVVIQDPIGVPLERFVIQIPPCEGEQRTVLLSELERKFGDTLLKIALCEQHLGKLPPSTHALLVGAGVIG